MENICRFIPNNPVPDIIQVINFVYETKRVDNHEPKISSVYRIHFVSEGCAIIQCGSVRRKVNAGDIFFIFPSVPYIIESNEEFKYFYISFIGIRANVLLERFKINSKNYVFDSFKNLEDIWCDGIKMPDDLIDLAGENVLLYTLTKIGEKTVSRCDSASLGVANSFLLVKKYIDDNFSDCNFSLDRISKEFSYNKKYLSTAFKKHFKIGIVDYINTIRINHACVLMNQNYTSVSDVAYLCGYKDPMYFSRIFKKKMKISPREYMNMAAPR